MSIANRAVAAVGLAVVALLFARTSLRPSAVDHHATRTALGNGRTRTSYQVVHGWPILPDGEMLGSAAGVGVDSRGNVLVFHRADRAWLGDVLDTTPIARTTVAIFDGRSGRLVATWGAHEFAMPHGLSVDGHDNVWLTDVALHQVYEFSHDGKKLLTLGERGVPGDDSAHFNRPTDVAVTPSGAFYVSDGYRNTRVLKFSAAGHFLFQWGTKGSAAGQFLVPHSVALDAQGLVYVADRGNERVQVFDSTGHFIRELRSPEIGRPYGVAIAADQSVVVADGGDQPRMPPDRSGVAVVDPAGKVRERFGRFGNYDGEFAMAHDVAVARDGSIYVVDITGRRVQKFIAVTH